MPPMSTPTCNGKRPPDFSQEGRTTTRARLMARKGETCFSPSFWDNLTKVSLTSLSLRELDRRAKQRHHSSTRTTPTAPARVAHRSIARFAQNGGPDLCHLRGYNDAESRDLIRPTRTPSALQSQPTPLDRQRIKGFGSSRSSAYGRDFEQHLTDHGIYMNNRRSKPKNIRTIRADLARERKSMSPSRFSEGDFERFQEQSEDITFESDVMATLFPQVSGGIAMNNKQNILFTELDPITDDSAVRPKPDFFEGAQLQDLDQKLREDQTLGSIIIPTKHPQVPIAANLFAEAKGPSGGADVARRQACYDGAYGARAMHTLQNYGEPEPEHDGNAYTYSCTYHAGAGTLQLFAHHVTAPSSEGGKPEYHMTQVDSWAMTGNIDSFRRGAAAFRNASELARRHRDAFIQAANAKAALAETVGQADAVKTQAEELSRGHDEPGETQALRRPER